MKFLNYIPTHLVSSNITMDPIYPVEKLYSRNSMLMIQLFIYHDQKVTSFCDLLGKGKYFGNRFTKTIKSASTFESYFLNLA